jgi:hypothetical protein
MSATASRATKQKIAMRADFPATMKRSLSDVSPSMRRARLGHVNPLAKLLLRHVLLREPPGQPDPARAEEGLVEHRKDQPGNEERRSGKSADDRNEREEGEV